MRLGIKSKIFFFTTGLFIVVLVLLLVIQSFIIGDYFERRQQEIIEVAVEDLVSKAFESPDPDKELFRLSAEYSMSHNSPFVVIDPDKNFFEQVHASSNTLLVQTDDGQVYNLLVEGFDPESLNHFNDGNWIEFSGFKMDEQNIRAFFIETENAVLDLESSFRNSELPMEEFEQMMAEHENHEVISQHGEILLNNARSMESQASQKLVGYHSDSIETFILEYGLESFFEDDGQRIFDFEDQWSSTRNRLIARPIFFPDGKHYLIIAIVTMSNTESIVSIFREFYWVNFIIAILLSFIATYLYAGRFAKPIRDMESIAKDMANMNFERKIINKSNDEIGSLANSLNLLSDTLQDKILALEDANNLLTDEIVFKTEQEEIRKAFVANVSHELKTPLTIMKGIMEGIKDGVYDDPIQLQSALDEANRMERLIFDMLEISKYEAKGIELSKSIFSLDESIHRVYRRFKNLSERKALQVTMDIDECFINADQDKIEQVLENLISNGIRYCKDKGSLTIKTEERPSSIYFTITNDGAPIPADAMDSIWKPFYRVDSSRSRNKGGTGLGLVIVKSILDAHSASSGAKNTPEGVQFWFNIEKIESDNN